MNTTELDQNLRLARVYEEARTKKGEECSRLALFGFRNSIERHPNNKGVTVKLSKNQVFQNSNKILDAKLIRINRRAGKENIQHKPVIVPSDLAKIRASPFLSMTTLAGLLRRKWFYVSLYWCRHGREGQRDLRRDSVKFTRHASLETSDLENNKNEYDKNNGNIFSVSYVITEKGKTRTVQRSMSCVLMKEKFVFC